MAYIRADEILRDLPVDEPNVDRTEAQEIINGWVGLVEDAGALNNESHTSRRIVQLGAGGEILKKVLRRSGYVETGEADDDIKRAETMLDKYDLAHFGTGGGPEQVPDQPEPVVVVDEFPYYSDDPY